MTTAKDDTFIPTAPVKISHVGVEGVYRMRDMLTSLSRHMGLQGEVTHEEAAHVLLKFSPSRWLRACDTVDSVRHLNGVAYMTENRVSLILQTTIDGNKLSIFDRKVAKALVEALFAFRMAQGESELSGEYLQLPPMPHRPHTSFTEDCWSIESVRKAENADRYLVSVIQYHAKHGFRDEIKLLADDLNAAHRLINAYAGKWHDGRIMEQPATIVGYGVSYVAVRSNHTNGRNLR